MCVKVPRCLLLLCIVCICADLQHLLVVVFHVNRICLFIELTCSCSNLSNTPTAFKLAMSLPGSRPDIIRKANISGPSPVGGSSGGTSDKFVLGLDEFEYQAAHYNLACTYACLGDVGESVNNLRKAFENGFDNYATVTADPDLEGVRSSKEFERLMEEFDPRRGFNPFGVFGN